MQAADYSQIRIPLKSITELGGETFEFEASVPRDMLPDTKPERRVILRFSNGSEDRFIPFVPYKYATQVFEARMERDAEMREERREQTLERIQIMKHEHEQGRRWFMNAYRFHRLFQWKSPIDVVDVTFNLADNMGRPVPVAVDISDCTFTVESYTIEQLNATTLRFTHLVPMGEQESTGIHPSRKWRARLCRLYFRFCSRKPVKPDRILIMSARGEELTDNLKEVDAELRRRFPSYEFDYVMGVNWYKMRNYREIMRYYRLYATSRVVIVDDYATPTDLVRKRPETFLVQLWHACGAFKTVGFGRFGRVGGPGQAKMVHRQYDLVPLSSKNIHEIYAEAFGLPLDRFIFTGLPRIDKYYDPAYVAAAKEKMYECIPQARGKKVYLFAPTFRGNGINTAHYPQDMLPLGRIAAALPEDALFLIKAHPFVKEPWEIPEEAKPKVLDITNRHDFETNDLLLICDRLITDYSSIIYEAALFGIPMAFYVFDLQEYFDTRSIYFSFEDFVPGAIDQSADELIETLASDEFCAERIESFKNDNFDHTDGNATKRVVDAIVERAKLG